MRKNSLSSKILFFIYTFQIVPHKAIRFINENYDHVGKVLKDLENTGYVVNERIENESVVTLTEAGYDEIKRNMDTAFGYDLSSKMKIEFKKNIKGLENKKRQIRLAYSLAMVYRYVPECIDNYLKTEKQFLERGLLGQSKIENSLKEEIRSRNCNSRWLMLVKEMRLFDDSRLKKMNSLRCHGVLHLETGNYVIYNHMSARMKFYNGNEKNYKVFIERQLGEYNNDIKAIIFAKSYKVALKTITSIEKNEENYLLTNGAYKNQYYVPLNNEGAQQIQIYTIPNFRETVRYGTLEQEDIDRAENTIYDGKTKDGDFIYLGFECNLNEIQIVYNSLNSQNISNNIIVYCFQWQYSFYKKLFGERAKAKWAEFNKLLKYVREDANTY